MLDNCTGDRFLRDVKAYDFKAVVRVYWYFNIFLNILLNSACKIILIYVLGQLGCSMCVIYIRSLLRSAHFIHSWLLKGHTSTRQGAEWPFIWTPWFLSSGSGDFKLYRLDVLAGITHCCALHIHLSGRGILRMDESGRINQLELGLSTTSFSIISWRGRAGIE